VNKYKNISTPNNSQTSQSSFIGNLVSKIFRLFCLVATFLFMGWPLSAQALSKLPFYEDFSYTNGVSVKGYNGWTIYSNAPIYGVQDYRYHGWRGVPGGSATATNGQGRIEGVDLKRVFGDYTKLPGVGFPTTSGLYDKAPLVTMCFDYEPATGYFHQVEPTEWSKYGRMHKDTRWDYENRGAYYKMLTTVRWFIKKDGLVSAYNGHRIKHLTHTPITNQTTIVVETDYIARKWSLWVGDEKVVSNFKLYAVHAETDMIHDGWYKDYDGLKEVGFVDASTNSASLCDQVRIYEGTRAAACLPLMETFESRVVGAKTITITNGLLHGQNMWYATNALISSSAQSTAPYSSGTKGVVVTNKGECLQLFLDRQTDVWTDLWMKPINSGNGSTTVDAGGKDAVFRVDTNGSVVVYNGGTPSVVTSVVVTAWNRFSVHTDYGSGVWGLQVNGQVVASGLAFKESVTNDAYRELRVSVSGTAVAYLDDVYISTVSPFLLPTVSFDTDTFSVSENIVNVTVTARLSHSVMQSVSVGYVLTDTGTALPTDDFTSSSGTLIFSPGETVKTFSFTVVNDSSNEENETLSFNLTDIVNALAGTYTNLTYTILSDPADESNIPFEETFEFRAEGDLDGQHGWDSLYMTVQTNDTYASSQKAGQGLRIASEHSHAFSNTAYRVLTEWRAKPFFTQYAPVVPSDASYALYVSTNGHIIAFNGTNAVDQGTGVILTSGAWAYFSVETDHTTHTWNLTVNGVPLAQNYGFYGSIASSYALFGVKGPVTIDDILVTYNLPQVPTGLVATRGDSQVVLDWSDVQGATAYYVKRATVQGGPYTVIATTNSTHWTDNTALNGVTYYYVISAENDIGESANSSEVSATPCLAIKGFGGFGGISKATLSWDAYVGATNYVLRRSLVAGGPYDITFNTSETTFIDTNVLNDVTYYYVVAAQTAGYLSTSSDEVLVTPNYRTIFYDSFEVPDVTNRPSGPGIMPPGWVRGKLDGTTADDRCGLWDEGDLRMVTPWGDQCAWVWNLRYIQTTNITETLAGGATYKLSSNVAAELALGGIKYKLELLAGTNVLSSVTAGFVLDNMDFGERSESLIYTAPTNSPYIGLPLGVRLSYASGDWHYVLGFDNVRLGTDLPPAAVLPNPLSFALSPTALPPSSIKMTATAITNGTGPISYYFENTTNGNNSGWITSTSWTNTALLPEVVYGYRVKARDVYGNQVAWSPISTAYIVDLVAPTPDPAEFSVVPWQSAPLEATMTAVTAQDPCGPVSYYFENVTASRNSGWTTNTIWTDTGLVTGQTYSFRVKARDASPALNQTSWSAVTNLLVEPKSFTVTFDKQSGTGGSDSVSAIYAAAMPAATMPALSGYVFGGYFTEINGGGTQYYSASMTSVRNWDIASATTLYAKWVPNNPEIGVKRGVATIPDEGYDTISGTSPGIGAQLTYSITNRGNTTLTIGNAVTSGVSNCAITITTQPAPSLVTGGGSTLVLTVTPSAAGAWSFNLAMATNDGKANPFNWTICGVTGSSTTTVLTATADTYINGASTASNYGTNTIFSIWNRSTGNNFRYGLLKFDLSSVPTNVTVSAATLNFVQNNAISNTVSIYEATNTWTELAATWNNSSTLIANTVLGSGTSPGIAGGALPTITLNGSGLARVQTWVQTPASNFGFGLKTASSGNNAFIDLRSREYATVAQRPKLSLTYSTMVQAPEMRVSRSAIVVADESTDIVTGTIRNVAAPVTYTIANLGNLNLTLTNQISAVSLSNCVISVTVQPGSPVAPSAATNVVLSITPTVTGSWAATVSVANNDADENPYNWTVRGTTDPDYTVTFDRQGGTGGSASVLANVGLAMPSATAPTRVGYTFGGYYSQVLGGGTQYYTAAMASAQNWNIASNTTLYAQWAANSYTVTFDGNGGGTPSQATTAVTYDALYGALATVTRTGYTFAGWYTAPTGGSLITSGTTVAITADQTLYAQWIANNYSVTFEANGGETPSPTNKVVTYDGLYGPLATVIRAGYTFTGWFTAISGGTQISSNTVVTITADQALYAQWTTNSYTVTFDANGGDTPSPTNKVVAFDSPYGALATVTRTGYTFKGWFTLASGGVQVTNQTIVLTASDHALYAQWNINSYLIAYNGNGNTGGTPPVSNFYNYGEIVTVQGNTGNLVKTGHGFTGWNTATNGSGTSYAPGSTFTNTGALTLYAQWTPDTYTITYQANGATGGLAPENQTKTYNVPLPLALNSNGLVRTGYLLMGWNTAANGGGVTYAEGANYTNNAPVTLYARWLADNSLTWDANGTTAGVNNGNGNWQGSNLWWNAVLSTNQNWLDGKDVIFGGVGTTGNPGTVTNAGLATVGSIMVGTAPAGTFTIGTAGQTNTVNGGIVMSAGAPAVTFVCPIALGGAQVWQNDSANLLFFNNGLITGSSTLTNNGTGRVSILGDNTGFSGNVIVLAGELEIRSNVTATNGSLGTGNVEVNGGVVGLYNGNTLTRVLGAGAGEIQITDGVSGFTGNGNSGSTVTLTGGAVWGSPSFNPTEFVLQRVTANSNGKCTFASTLDLNGAIRTIRADQAGGDLPNGYGTFSGNITNSSGTVAGLIKVGIGQHLLSGINTYDGGTTINEGTLRFDKIAAMPSSGVVTVNNGAILGVRVAAAGYWSGGTSGVGTLGGLLSGLGGAGTSTVVYNGNVGLLLDVTANTNYTGVIGNVGSSLAIHKVGTSSLTLSGNNTYSGGSVLYAGTVNLSHVNALGTGPITFRGGGVNNTSGASMTLSADNPIIIAGDLPATTYTSDLSLGAGAVTISGGNRTINVNAGGTLTLAGAIGQDVAGRQLTKAQAGKLALTSSSSSFTGAINITGGILEVTKLANGGLNSSIGASPNSAANVNISNGGVLRYVGAGDSSDRLFRFNGNSPVTITLDASGSGPISLTNNGSPVHSNANQPRTLNLIGANTGLNTLSASISNNGTGVLNVTKDGSGTWVLAGTNAYTGTTGVNAGKLLVNGSLSNVVADLTVASGATLGGTGTIGRNVTISDSGKLEFEISTPAGSHNGLEIASGRDFTFAGTSELTIVYAGNAAPGTYTLVTGGNNIAGLAPATVNVPPGWDATVSVSTNSLILTLNAINPVYYTVSYNGNGSTTGSVPVDVNSPYLSGSTVTVLGNTNSLQKTGYTFAGWNTATNGSGNAYAPDAPFVITTNRTLFAQWTVNSYIVTFDANGGGTPSPTSKSVTYDSTYGALAAVTRTGYTFNGWFTAASGGTQVTSGSLVDVAAAQTLYAQWTPNSYTVTFDANGGAAPTPVTTLVTYHSAYGALATVSRMGYTFSGWFTAASGGTNVTSATTVTTAGAHTLYAQWTELFAPTALSATAVSSTQIDLAWTDNSADETGFLIERSATSGLGFVELGTVEANVTNFTDNTVNAGETWYYRVMSTNGPAYSFPSDEASATTPKLPATVTLGSLFQTYDGTARIVTATTVPTGLVVTVTYNGSALAPTNVGTYAVTGTVVSASYEGSTNDLLVVSARNAGAFTVASVGPFTYDGTAKIPQPQVNDGATVLIKDTDYTLAYAANTNAGSAMVTVTGIGNYEGSTNVTFMINPATLTVTPTAGLSKIFGGADPVLTYTNSGAVAGETAVFSGALTRTAGETTGSYAITQGTLALADNGVFRASNYTLSFTAGVNFTIIGKDASTLTIADIAPLTYDGSAKTPQPEVRDGTMVLTNGVDYTLSYSNNTMVGTATITVTGIGGYSGAQDKTFQIMSATPTVTWPVASSILIGQAVSNATLTGGSASVPGNFNFVSPATVPPVGVYQAGLIFVPSDAVNYLTVTGSVSITVVNIYAVPFLEPFEARTLGTLNGQYGWLASSGVAVQSTNTFNSSQKAAQITGDNAYLKHAFNDARTKVWTDCRARIRYYDQPPVLEADATVGIYVLTNGMVMAYNGNTPVATGMTVAQDTWVRFTIFSDYAAKTYVLYVNDVRLGKYGFYNAGVPSFSEFKVTGDTTFVDNISLTPSQPPMKNMPSLILLQ
jgi:uncharacterized repeat protein (TIGR02543 family)